MYGYELSVHLSYNTVTYIVISATTKSHLQTRILLLYCKVTFNRLPDMYSLCSIVVRVHLSYMVTGST